jgi:hypothetical protein
MQIISYYKNLQTKQDDIAYQTCSNEDLPFDHVRLAERGPHCMIHRPRASLQKTFD